LRQLIAFVPLFLFVGCGAAPTSAKHYTIAVMPKGTTNAFFAPANDGAKSAANEITQKGPDTVEVLWMGSMTATVPDQISVLDSIIGMKVNGILMSATSGADPTLDAEISKGIAANIPFMTYDSDAPNSGRLSYLALDDNSGGHTMAKLLAKSMGSTGKVIILSGKNPPSANLLKREQGFRDEIAANYPGMTIVTTVYSGEDSKVAPGIIEDAITATPDVGGFFMAGGWAMQGFDNGASMPQWQARSTPGAANPIKNVVFNAVTYSLNTMAKGYLQALAAARVWTYGHDGVTNMYNYLATKAMVPPFVDAGIDFICPNNLAAEQAIISSNNFSAKLPTCDQL